MSIFNALSLQRELIRISSAMVTLQAFLYILGNLETKFLAWKDA